MKSEALKRIPGPSSQRIAVRIKPHTESVLRGGHPWLYGDAITNISRPGAAGDVAVIFDRKKRFLAAGLFDPQSPIRVRILVHRHPEMIDASLFRNRLATANTVRSPLSQTGTNGYRLVYGANDGFPGLVIDRYDGTYVIKLYTSSWLLHLPALFTELVNLTGAERVTLRMSRRLQQLPELLYGLEDGSMLLGDAPSVAIPFQENGLRFEADIVRGQKTGFFLDQRENRQRVGRLADGKSLLNAFSYSGGFSLYAARGGAVEVTDIDQSEQALADAQRHFDLNQHLPGVAAARHETIHGNVFEVLPVIAATGRRFDLVVLDPPAFARRNEEIPGALKAYARLARQGLKVLKRGGILVSSSCSSRVTERMFFDSLHGAARASGRPLHEIERTAHALDHPVSFKEGAYLKTLFARVD